MKNLIRATVVFSAVIFTACTSTQELRSRPVCSVWQEGPLGTRHVTVNDGKVVEKSKCAFMFWLCSHYRFDVDAKGDIYSEGPGLFSSRSKTAHFEGDQVVYEPSFLKAVVESSPIRLDKVGRTASRTVTMKVMGEHKSDQRLEFNESCRPADAAVGAVAVWALENARN